MDTQRKSCRGTLTPALHTRSRRVTLASSAVSSAKAGVVMGALRAGAAKFSALAGEITISMALP